MSNVIYIGIDPVIFKIGPLTIGWYGLMTALAVITVVGWLYWQNRKSQLLSTETVFTIALVGIPSGIIFSKILHIIDKGGYYLQNPGQMLSGEGLTIWGAVIGATIGTWIYSRFNRQFRFSAFGDLIAPGIILAQAIGRVGCTLNGCCYGEESLLGCAVIYTHPNSYAPLGIPVLPTHIFEIGYDLAAFGILYSLRGRLIPEGSLFVVYYALYGAWRFGIEFIRDGSPFLFGMHQAQIIAIIVLAVTIPIIIMRVRWKKKMEPAGPENYSA